MEAYFDNSSTTKPYDEVVETMVKMLAVHYGNPSSLHIKGIEAERAVKNAREIIACALAVKNNEIFFTSGGTESNNMAILGAAAALKRKGNHIITTVVEHPSVLNTIKHLEDYGYKVSYIKVDNNCKIDIDQFERELNENTILVSIMHVNNEVGTVQPLSEIRKILDKKNSKALLHIDAIQSFGKIPLKPEQLGIDLLSVSAHKLHGPKGVGAIYVKKGVQLIPIVYGGNQESDYRSGTENVPGITGFGKAVEIIFKNNNKKIAEMKLLKNDLAQRITDNIENIFVNGAVAGSESPNILNVSFLGIRAEVLLHALGEKGIYISTGSACSSNKASTSHVLTAMGLNKERIESAVRFSLSDLSSVEDIDYFMQHLPAVANRLRKYSRR